MDAVASDPPLFVGALEEVETSSLRDRSIQKLVVLTREIPEDRIPADVEIVSIPMMDGPRNSESAFASAVTAVSNCLDAGEPVAVCCSAGASRSPAVAATALAQQTTTDLPEAFEQVSNRRQEVDPHEALIQQAVSVHTTA